MTPLSRRARWIAPPVVLLLTAGTLAALQAPASAAQATFTQSTATYLGDPGATSTQAADLHVPATGTGPGVADAYPSDLVVSQRGVITDVNVVLTGLTSTAPTDLDLLLVG